MDLHHCYLRLINSCRERLQIFSTGIFIPFFKDPTDFKLESKAMFKTKNWSITGLKVFAILVVLASFVLYAVEEQLRMDVVIIYSIIVLLGMVLTFARFQSAIMEWSCIFVLGALIWKLSTYPEFENLRDFISFEIVKTMALYYTCLVLMCFILHKDKPKFYVVYIHIIALVHCCFWALKAWNYGYAPWVLVQQLPTWSFIAAAVFAIAFVVYYLKDYHWLTMVMCFAIITCGFIWTVRIVYIDGYAVLFCFCISILITSLGANTTGKAVVAKTLETREKAALQLAA